MKLLRLGFWDIVDQTLRCIGRGAAWLLMRRPGRGEESAYVIAGGALLCALIGGAVGFALSDLSRDIATTEGAVFGGLLGACMGIFFGSFVEAVDSTIKDLLRSLNSK